MNENKSYIDHLKEGGGDLIMLDAENRRFKAGKIILVLEDFAEKNGKRLSDLRCLDIGCSTGLITALLAEKFNQAAGVDTDEKAIKIAKRQKKYHKNIDFTRTDGLQIPYPDNSFDVVVCNHVYEHVFDASRLFNEIYRVLAKDGFCYLSAVNKYCLNEPHYHLPFLSWLPQGMANLYLRAVGKGRKYEEKPLSYWQIKNLLKKFSILDYTLAIIKNPRKYFLTDIIKADSLITKIPTSFLKILKPLIPNYIFILTKK